MQIELDYKKTMISQETFDDDLRVIDQFLDGDEIAFTSLVNKYRRYIYSIAYRFMGSHEEADDLTQETFIRVYHHLQSFRRECSFKSWISRIVSNLAINQKQSSRISNDSGLTPEDVDLSISAEGLEQIITDERDATLRQAINNLPDKQRQTLILRTFRDLPCKEVADIMKCSVGTVKANLFNALKNLKKQIGAVK